MKLEYKEIDGIYYPDFKLSENESYQLGKYGLKRRNFLKDNRNFLFQEMLINGELYDHLRQVDEECRLIHVRMIEQYKKKWGVTEEMKENDPIRWAQVMNQIEMSVDEFILKEYINF